jgi:hypothetical protein
VCDHENIHEYIMCDISSYFNVNYYEKNPSAPRTCYDCGDKKVLGYDIPVNAKNPVYICKQSKCNHALCSVCYNTMNRNNDDNGTNKKRTTKQTKRLKY